MPTTVVDSSKRPTFKFKPDSRFAIVTNSYHVFVEEKIAAFSKLKLESEFQELSPGGYANFNIALTSHLEIV